MKTLTPNDSATHSCNPSTWWVEVEGSGVQGQSELHEILSQIHINQLTEVNIQK